MRGRRTLKETRARTYLVELLLPQLLLGVHALKSALRRHGAGKL